MTDESTEKRLFLAELRAARPSALQKLRRALRSSGGSVRGAAASLGVGLRTLYDIAELTKEVDVVLGSGMGRTGAAKNARESVARKKRKKTTDRA